MLHLGALLFLVAAVSARMFMDPTLLRSIEQKQRDLRVLASAQANCTAAGWSTPNGANPPYPWKTFNFFSKIDHFSYRNTDKFNMRYFISNCYYKKGGPIFFYTGNEGDLEDFATNTGIMWDLAPQFNAAIIFAEHRFYGKSQPFGDKSYSSLANLGYLTAEQALGDYADFLIALKGSPNNDNLPYTYSSDTPVIAFGGSYGGMLAAWMRMKYPHLITGAWASSAPLLYVTDGGIPIGKFDNIATRTFNDSGCNPYITYNWWQAIVRLSKTADGAAWLNQAMNIDKKSLIVDSTGGINLIYFIREGFEYMAMVDYPYPSSFLTPMPGFPVTVACTYMNAPGTSFTDKELATMAYQASQVYYNNNGTGPNTPYCIDPAVCGDPGTAGLGDAMGWPWQECSEIIMIMASTGAPNDMFWDETGGDIIATLADDCTQTFGDLNWTPEYWNLKAVETRFGLSISDHSRIILTQGYLDPWSGGGYTISSPGVGNNGIYVQEIQGSAHHLDLRTPNVCDPPTISNMRFQIVKILNAWIQKTPYNPPLNSLPIWNKVPVNQTLCAEVHFGYPWGQADPPVTTPTPNTAFSVLSYLGVITALLQAF